MFLLFFKIEERETEHRSWKLNIGKEFNILIKLKLQKIIPSLLFLAHKLPIAYGRSSALGLTFTDFSGSRSGLVSSFKYISKCLQCVVYIFFTGTFCFYQLGLIIILWFQLKPCTHCTNPHVKWLLPILSSLPSKSCSRWWWQHLPFLLLYTFLWSDASFSPSYSKLGYKFLNCKKTLVIPLCLQPVRISSIQLVLKIHLPLITDSYVNLRL